MDTQSISNVKLGCVYTGNKIDDFRSLAEDLIDNENNFQAMSERGHSLSHRMYSFNNVAKQIVSSLLSYT